MDKNKDEAPTEKNVKNVRLLLEGRRMYLAELGKQLLKMEQLVKAEDWSREQASRYYHILHGMKGSAPVFGLERIGALALSCLPAWEWAVDRELPAADDRELSAKAWELWRQLKLEYEVCIQELELDGKEIYRAPDTLRSRDSRVLLIDDDEVLRYYLVRRLTMDGYQVDEADGVQSALKLLREHKYDLVMLDLIMQPESGYELFVILKEDPTLKWIPLIVLSGRNETEEKVRCFYLGADDYVTKPFQYAELEARIHSQIQRTKSFEQLAFRDPLTGISNRRYFDYQLEMELQRVSRYPAPLSIAFIDIDRFKAINDTYGHGIGDLVLQGLASLLQQNVRASDLLARFGGEEFVVVMPNTEGPDAKSAMEAILDKVRSAPVATHEGEAFRITFSAGVSEWIPGDTKEEWIQRADQAMYAAKQEGRNRVLLYEPRMETVEAANRPKEPEPGSGKKLLIADDNGILRSLLAAKLKKLQIDVLEAEDGEEALRLIREHHPDGVILDGVMPKLGGFELLKLIRSDEELSKLKVLMLSGKGRRKDVVRGLKSGADDYMVKPFSVLELELRVKRMLGL